MGWLSLIAANKGYSLVALHARLLVVAFLVAENRLWVCELQLLQDVSSVVAAYGASGFSSCGT